MKLSIIVPVFNERQTIRTVLERLSNSGCGSFEWIVVNDGSTDGTGAVLDAYLPPQQVCIHLTKNQGKTAAVRAGLARASGEWIIVQDADLEYDPAEILRLLQTAEVAAPQTVAVYGRRPSCWQRPSRWLFAAGVLSVDLFLLLVYRRWVRDHASCYKLVPRAALQGLDLQSTGFEGCVEITAKLMRNGTKILQVPISYSPRSTREGKKLRLSYGWTALSAVWRFRNWNGAGTSP